MLSIRSSQPPNINTFVQLRYSKRAPISVVNTEQAIIFTRKLNQNINDWRLSPEENAGENKKIDLSYQVAWNERIDASRRLLNNQKNYFLSDLYVSKNIRFYVYNINAEIPVGMMVTSCFHERYLAIERLVTHPGSMGCGGALIEKAVRYSEKQGYQGVVKLIATDHNAMLCYRALGFKEEYGPRLLRLDPNSSKHWEKNNDNKWSLKKYLTTFYVENVFKEIASES